MVGVNGVESVVYGVNDVPLCTRYFDDFGRPFVAQSDNIALFGLEEGSAVIFRTLEATRVEGQKLVGIGVQHAARVVDAGADETGAPPVHPGLGNGKSNDAH